MYEGVYDEFCDRVAAIAKAAALLSLPRAVTPTLHMSWVFTLALVLTLALVPTLAVALALALAIREDGRG